MKIRLKINLIIFYVIFISLFFLNHLKAQSSDGLHLVSYRSTSDSNFRYITGTVKNTGSETYDGVTITFNLYDSSGSIIANTSDTILNFRPGATWKFKAIITEEEAVRFEFDSLEGY